MFQMKTDLRAWNKGLLCMSVHKHQQIHFKSWDLNKIIAFLSNIPWRRILVVTLINKHSTQ